MISLTTCPPALTSCSIQYGTCPINYLVKRSSNSARVAAWPEQKRGQISALHKGCNSTTRIPTSLAKEGNWSRCHTCYAGIFYMMQGLLCTVLLSARPTSGICRNELASAPAAWVHPYLYTSSKCIRFMRDQGPTCTGSAITIIRL